jgi:hypothetical protein
MESIKQKPTDKLRSYYKIYENNLQLEIESPKYDCKTANRYDINTFDM